VSLICHRITDHPEVKFTEGDHFLAFLNRDYPDKKLPHHMPQFIAAGHVGEQRGIVRSYNQELLGARTSPV
jgi:hypothetical protein